MKASPTKKPIVLALVFVALAVLACFVCLSGCKDSDALKKVVYDQLSDNVDHNSKTKFYLHDDTSKKKSDRVSAAESSDKAVTTKRVQNLVVYSSKPNTKKYKTKQSLWDANPQFKGLEASSPVTFYKSDDPSAPQLLAASKKQQEEDKDNQEDKGTSADDSKEGDLPTATSVHEKPQDASDAGGDGGKEEVADDEGNDGDAESDEGDEGGDTDATDPTQDVPKVECVAAYGELAVMVQMIGGKGALVGADANLLASKFSKVFSDEDAAKIKTVWSGSGGEDGKLDVNAVIASGADAVLYISSADLTAAQKKKLKNNKIKTVQLYRMTNSKYIKKNIQTIGDMLNDSSKIQTDFKPADKAQAYVDFVSDLLHDTCKTANGSKTKLAGSETFELKNTTNYDYNSSDCLYTLLLDEYDASAKFTDDVNGWKPVTDGVFLSKLGYQNRSTSFYLQAGGLVNTAAVKGKDTSGLYIAHQFNSNTGTFDKTCFNQTTLVSKSLTRADLGSGWDSTLFCVGGNDDTDDTTLSNLSINFGAERFPKVIVTTEKAKTALVENSKDENGFYHPFGVDNNQMGSFFGKQTSGGSSVLSCIGVPQKGDNLFANDDGSSQIPEDSVVVNPTGLFESWVDGTSAEAVLEAAWACDVVNESCDETATGWKQYVKDFYQEFYRYDLSDKEIAAMEEGEE